MPGLVVPKGWVWTGKEVVRGEVGRGRCPFMPPKSREVGVFGADCAVSSVGGGGAVRIGVGTSARGVVGVVASVE